jgi:hypothetical protein
MLMVRLALTFYTLFHHLMSVSLLITEVAGNNYGTYVDVLTWLCGECMGTFSKY